MRVSTLTTALIAWVFAAQLAGAEEVRPRSIRIQCDAFEFRADRGKTRVSSPELVTLEGMPAAFRRGKGPGELVGDDDRSLKTLDSIECAIAPYCLKDGKVKLDIECAATRPIAKEDRKDDGVLAHKLGMRLVRTVAWGERIVVPLRNTEGETTHTIEIVVTEEVALPHPEPDEVPPAPLRRAMWDVDFGARPPFLPADAVPFRPAAVPGLR